MTMPCLVHPHHPVDTLDRTTGPYNPAKNLRDTLIGRWPRRAQTLTHALLYHYQLRQAGVVVAVSMYGGLTQSPQTD